MRGMENEKTSLEVQKIGADGMMQNDMLSFTVSHAIEMIAVERGCLNKYRRRNREFLTFDVSVPSLFLKN
jgi:hypothetical protein